MPLWLLLLGVGVVSAIAGRVVSSSLRASKAHAPEAPATPVEAPAVPVAPAPATGDAAALRRLAYAACSRNDFDECEAKLNAARAIDPGGESSMGVIASRQLILLKRPLLEAGARHPPAP